MSNLILGKRYRGAVRMTENNDGQLRQVITIYPEEGKGKTKVASFVTEHGKVEVSQQSLFVKMKLSLPDYILVKSPITFCSLRAHRKSMAWRCIYNLAITKKGVSCYF